MRYHGGKGDAPRPIKDKEQFEKNWDAIFGKKEEKICVFCKKPYEDWGTHSCQEMEDFRREGENRYLEDRARRMGGDDGWRGD